jgi:hypothetical protein
VWEDNVTESDYLQTKIAKGGHVSPLDVPEEVYIFVKEVIQRE